MRITLLTTYFAPEVSSVTHLLSDLAEDLALQGHQVTVVANRPNRGLSEGERKAYEGRTDETLPSGVRILRVGPRGIEQGSLIQRGLRFVGNTLALYRAAKQVPTDAYLINSMPPYLGLAGAALSKKAKTCFIYQDIFPDSILAMGKLKENSPVTRVFRWMESVTRKRNHHFITISRDMKQTLVGYGIPEKRITVIPNWADVKGEAIPRESNPLVQELNLDPAGFYAVYGGALGYLQTPELLLEAAKLLEGENSPIRILIFGSGGLENRLKERIANEGITNVSLFPSQPVERAHLVYALGDLCLVPLKKGLTSIAMPSKTWSAMAAGRPVLAAAEGGSAFYEQVQEAGGLTFAPEDAESLKNALCAAYENREALPALGRRAQSYIKTNLSRRASTEAYGKVLEELKK